MGEHEASKGIFVETLYARETSLFHTKKIFLKQVCGETSPVWYFSQRRGKKTETAVLHETLYMKKGKARLPQASISTLVISLWYNMC